MHYTTSKVKIFLDSKLNFIFPVLLSIYLIILYFPMFLHEGSLISTDQPMWTAFTYLMKHEIIPGQKWFWSIITDRENAGLLMGSSYSLNHISLWILSHYFNPALSVKIFLFLCVLSITVSIYFVSSRLSNPIIGIITALLSITVIFNDANKGMCYSYLSFSFALFFWLSSIKFLKSISTKYWMLSVILMTLSIYTHPIGFIACLLIWISLLIFLIKNKKLKPFDKVKVLYFVIPFISILLSAPQIFAILFSTSAQEHQQIISIYSSNFFYPTLKETLNLKTYLPNYVGFRGRLFLLFFMIVGLVSIFKKENQLKLPLISLCVVFFLLVSKMLMLSPIKPNVFYKLTIYYWRFFPYFKIVCIVFIGVGLHFIFDKFINFTSKKKIISLGIKLVSIMIILAPFGLCARTLTKNRMVNAHSLVTFNEFYRKEEISSLWNWLLRNVDSKVSRVYFEDTLGAYPSKNSKHRQNHILALTSIATDIKQIGGWCGFTSAFGKNYNKGGGGYLFHTDDFHKLSGNTVAENLKLLNCKFVIAHSTNLVNFLKNLNFLKETTTIGDFTIFEYKDMIPTWGFKVKNEQKIEVKKISLSRYNIIANGHTGDSIHLSLAYHSNWKAYYKNSEIPIYYNKAFMQIKLPATGNQTIELRYTIEKMKPVVLLFIGMTIFIYLLFYIHNRVADIKQKNCPENNFGAERVNLKTRL